MNKTHLMPGSIVSFSVECSTSTKTFGINALLFPAFHQRVKDGLPVCERCLPRYRKRLAKILKK
jgi:hypothetical protein